MKYIEIIEIPNLRGKTKCFRIANKKSGDILGNISWYSHWRQYCFIPVSFTIFSASCLDDISGFIKDLMTARRDDKAAEKEEHF